MYSLLMFDIHCLEKKPKPVETRKKKKNIPSNTVTLRKGFEAPTLLYRYLAFGGW